MSITYLLKPDYVVSYPLTGDHDFNQVWVSTINTFTFQIQWTSGLATGFLNLYGSNHDLSQTGAGSAVTYPPPLTPILLNQIDVSAPPYNVDLSGLLFDQDGATITSFAFVWIGYRGAGGGSISIALSGKSFG